jgi:Na+/melibiose symporter-like transporter
MRQDGLRLKALLLPFVCQWLARAIRVDEDDAPAAASDAAAPEGPHSSGPHHYSIGGDGGTAAQLAVDDGTAAHSVVDDRDLLLGPPHSIDDGMAVHKGDFPTALDIVPAHHSSIGDATSRYSIDDGTVVHKDKSPGHFHKFFHGFVSLKHSRAAARSAVMSAHGVLGGHAMEKFEVKGDGQLYTDITLEQSLWIFPLAILAVFALVVFSVWRVGRLEDKHSSSRGVSVWQVFTLRFFLEVAVSALLPEMAFAVTECVLVPQLVRLGAPGWSLGVGWVANAVMSSAAQPVIGNLSDVLGRRYLAVIVCMLSALTMAALAFAERGISNAAAVWLVLSCFAISDAAHDTLYVLVRSMFGDEFNDRPEVSTSLAEIFLCFGKALGFLVVLFPWQNAVPGLKHHEGCYAFVGVAMGAGGLLLGCVSSRKERDNDDAEAEEEAFSIEAGVIDKLPREFIYVMVLSWLGWMSKCFFEFYITSMAVEGVTDPAELRLWVLIVLVGLTMQAAFTIPLAPELPKLYQLCGRRAVNLLIFGAILYVIRMTSLLYPKVWIWAIVLVTHSLSTLITTNAPYLWMEGEQCGGMDKELVTKHRGFVAGSLNIPCPLGTVTAGLASPFVSDFSLAVIPSQGLQVLVVLAILADRAWVGKPPVDPTAARGSSYLSSHRSSSQVSRRSWRPSFLPKMLGSP